MPAYSKEVNKWYGLSVWRKLRHMTLMRDPVCMMCQHAPATEADHIKPHRGDWNLFTDLNNTQGLCRACHSKKTAEEDGGFGRAPKPNVGPKPVPTGEPGRQFVASSVKPSKLDEALGTHDELDELLKGI